jgi:hypothetical protein
LQTLRKRRDDPGKLVPTRLSERDEQSSRYQASSSGSAMRRISRTAFSADAFFSMDPFLLSEPGTLS